MRKNLALIAVAGFGISVISLSVAFAINGGKFGIGDFNFSDLDLPRCNVEPTGELGNRQVAWNGGDSVDIKIPANVHYRPGSGVQLFIRGDPALLPHIHVANGIVRFDCRPGHLGDMRFDVILPGRTFLSFAVGGVGSLTLDDIDQPELTVSLAGTANVAGNGKTGNLNLSAAGLSDAKFGQLLANRVKLQLAGESRVEISPKDDLHVDIAGSGTVILRTEPRNIETHIAGSGRIIHAAL